MVGVEIMGRYWWHGRTANINRSTLVMLAILLALMVWTLWGCSAAPTTEKDAATGETYEVNTRKFLGLPVWTTKEIKRSRQEKNQDEMTRRHQRANEISLYAMIAGITATLCVQQKGVQTVAGIFAVGGIVGWVVTTALLYVLSIIGWLITGVCIALAIYAAFAMRNTGVEAWIRALWAKRTK